LAAGNEEARAWLLGAREAALRADLWLAVREKARTGRTTADIDALRRRLKDQAQAVRQFMMGRYQSSDVRVVGEDRFQSALRLVDRLAASQI
jgi:hypothetical protein